MGGGMRIGMMADVYQPHISGITNYISLNKVFLEKRGHEVYVFTSSDMDYTDNEPNIIRSPGLPLLDTGYSISLSYTSRAKKLLSTMEVVHVHHPFLSGSLALRYCRPRGIPIIFTNHTRYDLYSQAYLPPMADIIGAAAVQAYLPAFCRACDMVISPSAGMRDVLVGFGVDTPIEIAPNGVDLRPFQNPSTSIDRQELGFSAEDVVLIYVGRLGPEKNLQFLLRSFAGVVQAYDHARLLLIGDGPERESLQELVTHTNICDCVKFTGMMPYEKIPAYLKIADAFVTASVSEVHPLTVVEAMAAGLPVLGISSPGIGDTIRDGESGYLVAQEDMASFTAKMVRLVREDDYRRQMGETARQAAAEYDIERTTEIMEERYRKMVDLVKSRKRSLRTRFIRWKDAIRS
jgi:glycosyltransferase involved in cell wall biosynthesis